MTHETTPEQEADLSAAMTGFLSEFKSFRDDIQTQISTTEGRISMLDRKSQSRAAARPALSQQADADAPHQKAFAAYVRSGDDDALRGLELEGKALNSSIASEGGYLVDPQTSERIQSTLSSTASLRAIANIVNVEATSYDVLIDHGTMGAGWATEAAAVSETATPTIDRISIPLHELSALPKASQRLLDDSAFDIEGWLASRIADTFARAEAAAFISGDGIDKPRGILTYPTAPADGSAWGQIGEVLSGADGDLQNADAVIDLVYALPAQYRANASFVMNSRTAGDIRKLKDADGRFLWSDGLAAGQPARLLGYPVLVAEDMPDPAAGSLSLAFGDFSRAYTVAERPDLRVLRDPFSAKPNVLFYATKRVGGDVSDFEAIKVMRFSV